MKISNSVFIEEDVFNLLSQLKNKVEQLHSSSKWGRPKTEAIEIIYKIEMIIRNNYNERTINQMEENKPVNPAGGG